MAAGKSTYKLLALAWLLLVIQDCSVEKNTATTRFYHGFTAKYNIYFNGYESFKAGIAKINKGHNDDFSELLRVFENSDPAAVSLCSSDMEKAIQKASKLISLKSITAKPEFNPKKDPTETEKKLLEQKEFNVWVDDSYFLVAKARFYKHEFADAASVFSYCISDANDPEIRLESSVWLARTYCERGNNVEAARLLNEMEITADSRKSLKAIYYPALADILIRQKKYQEAIVPLSESLKYISGKRTRYRLTYLLAQLYERSGDADKSIALYRDVVKMNPPYDVEFNAQINIAGVFDVNSGNPQEISRELERMLKDAKNKDYQDQIYYALGNLMKREGKEKEALDFYRKSASASSVNQNQKGKSYLALADYYYSKPDYMKAGLYYDSTVYFLDQKYPDYKDLQTKSRNLNDLVKELIIIQTEDSLQKVARMPEKERETLIAGIIDRVVKAESQGKTSEYNDRANIGQYYENERRSQASLSQEGKWYFYNQNTLTFGRTEFRRRWGDRRLEDNWRRSNKARVNVTQASTQEETGKQGSDTSKAVMDYKKPEFYLKNLPLTDSLIAVSNVRISNAYFNAGKVFSEKISDPQKASESYETLLTRFPESELIPETLYELYKVYRDSKNTKAEITRQRLLEKFPGSEFSRILSDPDYFNRKIAANRQEGQLYEKAYTFYSLENFPGAIALCDSAAQAFPKGGLKPKFMLLKAYSVGRISDERGFKEELGKLIKEWPESEEGKKAAELNAYLNQKLPELKIEEDKEIAKEIYVADTTSAYSFAVVIMDPGFNVNQASFDVISYNIDNYTNKNYKTEGMLTGNKYIRILVSGFANNTQAWEYFKAFNPEKVIRNPQSVRLMTFLINSSNLKALENDKNPERYYLFFNENYLNRGKIK
ncbi:MAG: tetratricopeptide repeat protein [Bacteroidota bacterium]|nr:tetratricopeptide repeat protein [Bacteroidota bacterium]